MEASQYTVLDNPLVQGIKVIGIGKHGSKPLSTEQIDQIVNYLAEVQPISIQKGAFFGSLLAKGVTYAEQKLLCALDNRPLTGTEDLYETLCPDAPANMREIGIKLLNKDFLSKKEAEQLGHFLYSDAPGESFRGMAASMLRIRYETDEEYHGLLEAAKATFTSGFKVAPVLRQPLVQLTEPFDGVEHSYMITPLLARAIQQQGYTAVTSMGRTSGPKLTLDSVDLYKAIEGQFLESNTDLEQPAPEFGWALNQEILSPALDAWVDRRKLIFKRPFLATLEKVLNPCGAQVLLTSVFHLTYIEKMIRLAAMAGFKAVIVLKRGLEGTLAPSIAKASGITCAVIQPDGSFTTHSIDANQEDFASLRAEVDEVVPGLSVEENARLIQEYNTQGYTGNTDFDMRVKLGIRLYTKGLHWIEKQAELSL